MTSNTPKRRLLRAFIRPSPRRVSGPTQNDRPVSALMATSFFVGGDNPHVVSSLESQHSNIVSSSTSSSNSSTTPIAASPKSTISTASSTNGPSPSAATPPSYDAHDQRDIYEKPHGNSLGQYRVKEPYVPREPDELILNIGDIILVTGTFGDGWGRGYSFERGMAGVVPMNLLQYMGPGQTGTQKHSPSLRNIPAASPSSPAENLDGLAELYQWLQPPDFRLTIFRLKEKRLESTRGWLLKALREWVANPSSSQVYWLSGVAGVGKSVIAGCFADELRQNHQLAAYFFCKHDEMARNDPLRLIATWAYHLATFDLDVRKALKDLLTAEPNFLQNTPSIGLQFEQLIVNPLSHYRGEKAVIILDALDECATEGSAVREEFLKTIARQLANMPSNILFFLTSRPLPDIRKELIKHKPHTLVLGSEDNLNDIKLYALARMSKLEPYLDAEKVITLADRLADMANGLFIWLYLACEEVENSDDPIQTLYELERRVLGDSDEKMDGIYTRALVGARKRFPESSLDNQNQLTGPNSALETQNQLIGSVIVLREQLSRDDLAFLLDMSIDRVIITLSRIESLLQISKSSVQLMHKSVADFLTSPTRCTGDAAAFYIDLDKAESLMAKQCMTAFPTSLEFEIVQSQIERLKGSALQLTPSYVRYAYKYWADHLNAVKDMKDDLKQALADTVANFGRPMLIVAVVKGLPNAVKYILQVGGRGRLLKQAEAVGYFLSPMLFEATVAVMPQVCEALLEYGEADIDCRSNDYLRTTPLYICGFQQDSLDLLKVFLRYGADMDAKATTGTKAEQVATGAALQVLSAEQARRRIIAEEKLMDEIMTATRKNDANHVKDMLNSSTLDLDTNTSKDSGKSLLHIASQYGADQVVALLLAAKANPNAKDHLGWTPLHYACQNGSFGIVKSLVSAGAILDIEAEDAPINFLYKATVRPLDVACRHGHLEIVTWLLDEGKLLPEPMGKDQAHPLLHAAIGDSVDVARLLIARGARVDYQSTNFGTALFAAAFFGSRNVVYYLLELGADMELGWFAPGLELPDAIGSPDLSPLYVACRNGYLEIVSRLVSNGANKESKSSYLTWYGGRWLKIQWSLLAVATIHKHPPVVQYLLENGCDSEEVSPHHLPSQIGGTPLLDACFFGVRDVARMLLLSKVSIKITNATQRTAMHLAAWSPVVGDRIKSDIVRMLKFHGVGLNDVDLGGNTPLHLAITIKASQTVSTLLELGADPNIVNGNGDTPLHEAVKQQVIGITKLLIERNAATNVVNGEGMTPLDIANTRLIPQSRLFNVN
ncbi:hypothetical protein SmJEL517_g04191 [Synchytrium microbalum]|uniref:SH3 domain-containing protein n=1 Tax=Synchytrium microbalum TaxID=1806994 RepID=A0A507BZ71_9FUNG|nr:uncharacterized protein SmJEL517_g04191 [Synchytrium microbalum]TPX32722.1 hypothetical protein SmJEL517_g04191 [Synchytrium microbalum]